jgi:potassium efflux system protein
LLLLCSLSHAQESDKADVQTAAATTPSEALDPKSIELRIKQLEAATEIEQKVKEEAIQLYQQALEQLRLADQHSAKSAQWTQHREDAPQMTAELKPRLAQPEEEVALDISDDVTVLQLEQMLATSKEKVAAAEAALNQLAAEPARRADRRAEVPKLDLNAKQRLSEIESALASAEPADPPELILARRAAYAAQKHAIEQEISLLNAELLAYDTTVELLALQEQGAAAEAMRAGKSLQALQELLKTRRDDDAKRQAELARISAVQAHPIVKPLAEENAKLARLRTGAEGLTAKIAATDEAISAASDLRKRLDDDRSDIEEKLTLPGMSSHVAPLLLQERSQLPRIRDLRRQIYMRSREIAKIRFAQSEIRKRNQALVDVDDDLATLDKSIGAAINEQQRAELTNTARELLQQRRQLLNDLQADYTSYFSSMMTLSGKQEELIDATEKTLEILDHDMLWQQAMGPITVARIRTGADAIETLFDVKKWNHVGRDWIAAVENDPLRTGLGCVLFLVLLATRGRTRRELRRLGELAGASYLVPYHTTLKALGLTIVLTLLWPAMVFAVGWCLYAELAAPEQSRAVGAGLLYMSVTYMSLEFWRVLCSRGGLAEAHFRWRTLRVRLIRRHLAWLGLLGLPLLTVVSAIVWYGAKDKWADLARILAVIGLTVIALFMQRTLRRLKSPAKSVADEKPGPVARSVYWFSIGGPLFCACLVALGYGFTAGELCERLLQTVWLGTVLVVFQGLALRWLRLVRGKRALEQVRDRQPTRQQLNSDGSNEGDENSDRHASQESALVSATEADLETINLHTRHLLQVCLAVGVLAGIWSIWLDVLPGVDILERTLWLASATVSVTVADLVLAVLVSCVAIVAARNMPGLVEVSLPASVPLDAGARYALSSLVRYGIIAVGIIIGCSLVGFGWSKVQWLVAAMSVGVGFGLQELVANFISGLIVLFERPVRVGDIVTVDDVTGVVTRVKIRATTIRNWDRQEYIVPNKDLITGRVMNWTLSDKLNRVVIKIGLAYGSDTEAARALLLKILDEQPMVLKDPAPLVTFEGFGDSTLDVVIRAVLPHMDCRLDVTHRLYSTIHEQFTQAGIEIAFPQRDLHIRSVAQATPFVPHEAAAASRVDPPHH